MTVSSRCGLDGCGQLKAAVVAQQRPQHIDAAAGQGHQRLLMLASLGTTAIGESIQEETEKAADTAKKSTKR